MQSLTISAPAKVNLFLGVGSIRPDGYHSVQTVLHTLALADRVTLTPADELELSCDVDLGIPAESNLAYRAARAFSAAYGLDVLLDITLAKRIPAGAGLGGGSSDAAAVLAGLAHWAGLERDDLRLLDVAASLGADVPFLLQGGAALMDGRGDHLVRSLKPIEATVVVVRPPAAVPTADAYRAFDADPQLVGDMRPVTDSVRFRDPRALAAGLANNMIPAAEALVPAIGDALAFLRAETGVLGATMAGSGSAVFAICDSALDAERISRVAEQRGWWSAATALSAQGPVVTESEMMV
ncbi:MAG: 4-(cytidine 5'-diphospho)-2-C-methyl-D-erythritol kinase [Coriobacteriia bacterium]|nr:4-(cytidine 5'-diphospho)-2-C-methyl-D-erythritol kinase [Coriobacteriia bacterium]